MKRLLTAVLAMGLPGFFAAKAMAEVTQSPVSPEILHRVRELVARDLHMPGRLLGLVDCEVERISTPDVLDQSTHANHLTIPITQWIVKNPRLCVPWTSFIQDLIWSGVPPYKLWVIDLINTKGSTERIVSPSFGTFVSYIDGQQLGDGPESDAALAAFSAFPFYDGPTPAELRAKAAKERKARIEANEIQTLRDRLTPQETQMPKPLQEALASDQIVLAVIHKYGAKSIPRFNASLFETAVRRLYPDIGRHIDEAREEEARAKEQEESQQQVQPAEEAATESEDATPDQTASESVQPDGANGQSESSQQATGSLRVTPSSAQSAGYPDFGVSVDVSPARNGVYGFLGLNLLPFQTPWLVPELNLGIGTVATDSVSAGSFVVHGDAALLFRLWDFQLGGYGRLSYDASSSAPGVYSSAGLRARIAIPFESNSIRGDWGAWYDYPLVHLPADPLGQQLFGVFVGI